MYSERMHTVCCFVIDFPLVFYVHIYIHTNRFPGCRLPFGGMGGESVCVCEYVYSVHIHIVYIYVYIGVLNRCVFVITGC